MTTTARGSTEPATEEVFLASLYKGGELLASGKVVEAREHLEKAHQLEPKNDKAQNLLGLTYFKLGLFEQAAHIYELLVHDNPTDPTLRVNLGLVHLKTNNLNLAIKEFETATNLDGEHKKAQNYLGLALAQAGEYARAKEHFILAGSDQMAEKMERARQARAEAVIPLPPVKSQPPPLPPPLPHRVATPVVAAPPPPPPADDAIEVMSDDELPPEGELTEVEAEVAPLPPPPAPSANVTKDWGSQFGMEAPPPAPAEEMRFAEDEGPSWQKPAPVEPPAPVDTSWNEPLPVEQPVPVTAEESTEPLPLLEATVEVTAEVAQTDQTWHEEAPATDTWATAQPASAQSWETAAPDPAAEQDWSTTAAVAAPVEAAPATDVWAQPAEGAPAQAHWEQPAEGAAAPAQWEQPAEGAVEAAPAQAHWEQPAEGAVEAAPAQAHWEQPAEGAGDAAPAQWEQPAEGAVDAAPAQAHWEQPAEGAVDAAPAQAHWEQPAEGSVDAAPAQAHWEQPAEGAVDAAPAQAHWEQPAEGAVDAAPAQAPWEQPAEGAVGAAPAQAHWEQPAEGAVDAAPRQWEQPTEGVVEPASEHAHAAQPVDAAPLEATADAPPSATDPRWDAPPDAASEQDWSSTAPSDAPPSATDSRWDAPPDAAAEQDWSSTAPTEGAEAAPVEESVAEVPSQPWEVTEGSIETEIPREEWASSAPATPEAGNPAWLEPTTKVSEETWLPASSAEASPDPAWVAQPLSEVHLPRVEQETITTVEVPSVPAAPHVDFEVPATKPEVTTQPELHAVQREEVAAGYAPLDAAPLAALGAASASWETTPGTGPFHLGPEGLAISVAGEVLARLDGLVAVVGSISTQAEQRRARGRASDQPFGTGAQQLQRVKGNGVVYLEPREGQLQAVSPDEEGVYLREERVFAFEEAVAFENGRLTAEGSPAVEMVHLTGPGRVLLQLEAPLRTMPLPAGAPMVVPLKRLVGWFGHVTPRLVGFGGQGAVELTGDGFALLSTHAERG
jgi:uncharacterized protein (AIM24 family)